MDWLGFFEANSIHYVTRGSNTRRGEASTKCPFCGVDDPSTHMGISLHDDNWGCWRDPQHRGKNPARLVQALLGCEWSVAASLVRQFNRSDPGGLDDALSALQTTRPAATAKQATSGLVRPVEWRSIAPTGSTAKFWAYLVARGFDDVARLVKTYGLACAVSGTAKDRVILPFHRQGNLIGWTARAIINPKLAPRYLSSGEAIKTTVFNEDELHEGGDTLLLVEGPFDALKVDYYGAEYGVRATCPFGTSMSMDQIYILSKLRKRFRRAVILFDHDAIEPSFYAADWLQAPNVSIGQLPEGVKDPGILSKKQVLRLIQCLTVKQQGRR